MKGQVSQVRGEWSPNFSESAQVCSTRQSSSDLRRAAFSAEMTENGYIRRKTLQQCCAQFVAATRFARD